MSTVRDVRFITLMQQRVADGSIGPSTLRNMGPKKTSLAVKKFLRNPELLKSFARAKSEVAFLASLDEQTRLLQQELPGGAKVRNKIKIGIWGKRWGVARKCLNIFLYECLNNHWLCEAYPGLLKLEPLLEVPLDSYVGEALHKADKCLNQRNKMKTPPWKNVIELTEEESNRYQQFASELAVVEKIDRVHLDLHFYNERKDG